MPKKRKIDPIGVDVPKPAVRVPPDVAAALAAMVAPVADPSSGIDSFTISGAGQNVHIGPEDAARIQARAAEVIALAENADRALAEARTADRFSAADAVLPAQPRWWYAPPTGEIAPDGLCVVGVNGSAVAPLIAAAAAVAGGQGKDTPPSRLVVRFDWHGGLRIQAATNYYVLILRTPADQIERQPMVQGALGEQSADYAPAVGIERALGVPLAINGALAAAMARLLKAGSVGEPADMLFGVRIADGRRTLVVKGGRASAWGRWEIEATEAELDPLAWWDVAINVALRVHGAEDMAEHFSADVLAIGVAAAKAIGSASMRILAAPGAEGGVLVRLEGLAGEAVIAAAPLVRMEAEA